MRIAILQINTTPGDVEGNSCLIIQAARRAHALGAELALTPELALMGYLPRDLLMSQRFVHRSRQALERIARELEQIPVLVGVATVNEARKGRPLFNSAVLLDRGTVASAFHKTLLPTYDVFDEDRYFEPACGPQILSMKGHKLGICICEDVWNDTDFWERCRYHRDPIGDLAGDGAHAILNLSASPFATGKQKLREKMLGHAARKYGVPVIYANQVGGNDDLIFDGRSCAFNAQGCLVARAHAFEEDVVVVDIEKAAGPVGDDDLSTEVEIWDALVLGVRDYVRKTGFSNVLLGLSGGIDSALTAAVAVDAVGKDKVLGVLMPSRYSSQGSIDDSQQLARNLGIPTLTLPISDLMRAYESALADAFQNREPDVTEENIQSRIRGNLLMALSNKYGSLLLTTGNKSELSVGYCTLYGDMNGGLAVIADLPKLMVYRLSAWRNRRRPDIPEAILTKAPSAELRPGQTDQDSLPPYEVLDAILELHVELCQSAEEIVAQGFDERTVSRVLDLVRKAEFKRRQAAPGLKVTSRAFGVGWRMPIARS